MPRKTAIDQDDQTAIDEIVIQDSDIEAALEKRQRAKDELAEKRLAVKNATEIVKQMIPRLEMPDPTDEDKPIVVRIARFRITKRFVKGRAVSFETDDRVQLTFGLADVKDADEETEPGYDDAVDEQAAIERLGKTSEFAKPAVADEDDGPEAA